MDCETIPPKTGVIYFVRAGRTSNIKIGWAKDAAKRIDALQTGCPHKLHLIGFAPGEPADETDWHYAWPHLKVRGEWFQLNTDLRMAINDRLARPDATRYIRINVL